MSKRCVAIILLSFAVLPDRALACTGFCAAAAGRVLVGNNEDDNNPFTVLWFVPAAKGTYGRVYLGYDDFGPQGGMNEKGLWSDAFATAPVEAAASAGKPAPPGNMMEKAMAECATVEEVVRLYSRYDRSFMKGAVLMFADASGDSVVIEPDAMLRKHGRYQAQTNFHQSFAVPEYRCDRFSIATSMLEEAGERISVDLFRRILAATHSEETYPTLYSNVYDLKRRVMYLYHFHDFANVVEIDLARELKKGHRSLRLRTLFPRSVAAEGYFARRAKELERVEPPVASVDPAIYDDYVGRYAFEDGHRVAVLREGRRLMVDSEGAAMGKVEMFPESPTRFFLRMTNVQVTFIRDGDRAVTRVTARINGRDVPGKRVQ
jgi:hypothetical protein